MLERGKRPIWLSHWDIWMFCLFGKGDARTHFNAWLRSSISPNQTNQHRSIHHTWHKIYHHLIDAIPFFMTTLCAIWPDNVVLCTHFIVLCIRAKNATSHEYSWMIDWSPGPIMAAPTTPTRVDNFLCRYHYFHHELSQEEFQTTCDAFAAEHNGVGY